MKKFIAMLLCAVMCVSTLAGCGSSTGNEADSSDSAATEAVAAESDWEEISAKGEMTIGMTLFAQ